MLSNILTVGEQVVVLFIMIGIGFVLARINIITEKGAKVMSDIALLIATPCVILKSFTRKFSPDMLKSFLICIGASVAIHVVTIIIASLAFKNQPDNQKRIYKFAAVFSNAGFMAIPLQNAILGADGVFFGASYVAVFNLFMWTWGLYCISGDKKLLSIKRLAINPGIVSVFIGMIIFLFSIPIPSIIAKPISFFADLNTPVPMLVIGYYLAGTKFRETLSKFSTYICLFIKLIIVPLLTLSLMLLLNLKGDILISMVISCSAPVAAATTMFSAKYDRDTFLSVNLVSVSTVFSVITMPLVIALAQYLYK